MKFSRLIGSAALCFLANGLASLHAATFTPLGDLPGGDFDSVTTDISDDGRTVVGFSVSDLGTEAFRWTDESGMVALASITGESVPTIARAVSDAGVIAGQLDYVEGTDEMPRQCSLEATTLPTAAIWDETNGFLPLGALPDGEGLITHDISADGLAAIGTTCEFFEDPQTNEFFEVERPFYWTQEIGVFPLGHRGEAFGISSDGFVMAGFGPLQNADGSFSAQAFRWTPDDGQFAVPLGIFDGSELPLVSEGYDVSPDGEFIVGAYIPDEDGALTEGYRWSEAAGFEGLGHLADFPSFAFDVAEDGKVVAGEQFLDDSEDPEIIATIWDDQFGLRNLQQILTEQLDLEQDLAGWSLTRSNGISADGLAIVGFGINPDGNTEGWLVRLDEIPPLQMNEELDGDYDNSGGVEQGDLDLVLLTWGDDASTIPAGWVNQRPDNGIIGQSQLDVVLLNWGNTAPAALAQAGAVPEPGSFLLLGIGSVAVFAALRRRSPLSRRG